MVAGGDTAAAGAAGEGAGAGGAGGGSGAVGGGGSGGNAAPDGAWPHAFVVAMLGASASPHAPIKKRERQAMWVRIGQNQRACPPEHTFSPGVRARLPNPDRCFSLAVPK